MVSIYRYKAQFQNQLRPWVKKINGAGITANQITVLTMLLSLSCALLVGYAGKHQEYSWFFLIPIWMFIRMGLNAIDGMLAHEFDQKTDLGAYLNELCDVISDTALYLSFMYISTIHLNILLIFIFLSFLTEYAGVMAPLLKVERRYDGPMGKSDRAFLFGLLGVFIGFEPEFNHIYVYAQFLWINFPNILLIIGIFLLIITIYNRVCNGVKQAKHLVK